LSGARPTGSARLLRSFTILVLVLYAAYLVRTISDDALGWRSHGLVGVILAGSLLVLASLAKLAWTRIRNPALRALFAAVVAYHALFGVAMLVDRIVDGVTSNDDLVIRVWPHVVHAIDSLE
jgi:hypothetical protein